MGCGTPSIGADRTARPKGNLGGSVVVEIPRISRRARWQKINPDGGLTVADEKRRQGLRFQYTSELSNDLTPYEHYEAASRTTRRFGMVGGKRCSHRQWTHNRRIRGTTTGPGNYPKIFGVRWRVFYRRNHRLRLHHATPGPRTNRRIVERL